MTYGFSHKRSHRDGGPSLDERADTYEVRLALLDRLASFVTDVVGKPQNTPMSSKEEGRWGSNGSLSVILIGPKRGAWFDHETGVGGGPFELIEQYESTSSFIDTKRWAKNWLGWSEDRPLHDLKRREQLHRQRAEAQAQQEREAEEEDRSKIAEAQAYWSKTIPAAGTLGEVYLTTTRGIPLETMPEAIRYHRSDRALIVGGSLETGEVVSLQRIYLTQNGQNVKLETKPGKFLNKKWTLGVPDDAPVRLPATKDGPICIAEGPETGISVWAATGYPTWITLGKGNIPNLTPPNGSTVVLLMDDDKPPSHKSQQKLNEAIKDWQRQGVTVHRVWPFEVRRFNGDDFNNLIKEAGAEGVRDRLRLALTPQSELSQLQVTLNHSDDLMGLRIGEFFARAGTSTDSDLVQAMSITLGAGKTHHAIHHGVKFVSALRASGDQRAIVYAGPEHKLNAQLAKRIKAEAAAQGVTLSVAVIRGREALLPDGDGAQKMCQNLDDIKLANSLWVDADEVCKECPFRDSCAYLDQRDVDADIFVVAHAMLTHKQPRSIGRRGIAALVVDETPRQGLVGVEGKGITLPLEALEEGGMRVTPDDDGKNLQFRRTKLLNAAKINGDGPLKRSSLIDAEFLNDTASLGLEGAYARKVEDGNWRDRIDNRSLGQEVLAWKGAIELMVASHEASGFISVGIEQDEATGMRTKVLRLTGRRDIGKDWLVPTLLIDASLNEALIKPFWPSVEVVARIDVEAPHQRVWQCVHPFSLAMLAPNKKGDSKKKSLNRQHINAYIVKLEREAGGRTLVISNKRTIDALKAGGLPDHIETAHFNALAGRDDWGDVTRVIIIGRTQPPPESVERMAGALTGKAPKTLGGEWYPSQDVYRLQKTPTGVLRMAGVANRHPDPIAEAVRYRICEDEVMQALGRGRGVRRTANNPLDVFILSDAVLPIAVDGLIPLDDVLRTTARDDMFAVGGVAFDEATAAHKAYPGLYKNPKAAQKKMERKNTETFWNKSTLIPKSLSVRAVEVTYQRAGPKQRMGRATVDLSRHSDPRAAIEALLGPLTFFEVVSAQSQPVSADVIAFPTPPKVPPVEAGSPEAPPPAPPLIEAPPSSEPHPAGFEHHAVIRFSEVRLALHERNLSMEDAAESVGDSHPHLINMLMGRRRLTPEVQAGIAAMIKSAPIVQRRLL